MNLTQYQQQAARTLIDVPGTFEDNDMMIVWNAIGLCGEAGELAELVKKGVFHRHGLDYDKARKEIGDCLWYLAALATKMGFNLSDIAEENIEKLKVRYPAGWSSADSVARVDVSR